MVRKTALTLLVATAVATPAQADWQWSRWGMTIEQLRAAAPYPLMPFSMPDIDRDDSVSRIGGSHAVSGRRFAVVFRFSSADALNAVLLMPNDNSLCPTLISELTNANGQPIATHADRYSHSVRWRNSATGNDIEVSQVNDGPVITYCMIEYRPIRSATDLGY